MAEVGNHGFVQSDSLCWRCSRATDGSCSWSGSLTPVDGWVAEITKAENHYGSETYRVRECPQFAVYENDEVNDTGVKRLAHAICARAMKDYIRLLKREKKRQERMAMGGEYESFNNRIIEMEKWFRSDMAMMFFQDNDPVWIMRQMQKRVGVKRP